MRVPKGVVTLAVTVAAFGVTSLSASAFDCTNPQKDANAPTGGVNWELTGFNQDGSPIVVQVGPGTGIGGFIEIAPGVFGNPIPLYTHSLGALATNPRDHNPHEMVGGPGSQKPNHACDGKGIDYLDACFGG